MRKLWIILGVTALCGIILMAVGYALGADSNYTFGYGVKNMHVVNKELEITQQNTDVISDIRIDVLSAGIEILPSDSYGYEILASPKANMQYSFQNGVLKIEQEVNWSPFHWFSFFENHSSSIKIFLPQNTRLSQVSLETSSGNITAKNFFAAELQASTHSGNIDLRNIEASHMDIDVTSGNSTLVSCTADSLETAATSGRFTANELLVRKDFDADIISGRLSITGTLGGSTDIKIISGSVTLDLAGTSSEYNKNLSSVSGGIRVSGRQTGSYTEKTGASNSLTVHTTSGSITVNFKD